MNREEGWGRGKICAGKCVLKPVTAMDLALRFLAVKAKRKTR